MIKKLFFFFLIFPVLGFSQNDTIIKGKIVSESNLLEDIHVINLTENKGTVTDSRGYFQIKAKVSDTLQFSAVNLKATRYVIKENDLTKQLLFIPMESLINELDEVAIIHYKNINAVSLGIVPANQKTYTPAERKVRTATTGLLDPLINLASDEYFKSVKADQLGFPIVAPVFQDEKAGKYKIVSFYAKRARGLMTRFIIDNKIDKAADLKDFDYEGYKFAPKESTDAKPVFRRKEQ